MTGTTTQDVSTLNDSATPRHDTGNIGGIGSRTVLEQTRRDLIVMREAHGADSPIGHRCSNIVELIQMPEVPKFQLERQMADLQRLRAAAH
jgi:hypothetical protein